jgi:G patch domain-containing protein 1
VSSRTNRAKAQQKAEDFMDEEDVADAEEAQRLQTAASYAGLGSTASEVSRNELLVDLARPGGETMGVKLLQRMGWKPGQGVGPKVRRKARLDGEGEGGPEGETHLFAPENSRMIGFVKKTDTKGLGYAGEVSLAVRTVDDKQEDDDDDDGPLALSKPKAAKGKKARKGAFGVGILNDTGSDDEDPYEIGPKISYNRVIGGDKKPKKNGLGSANPLLAARPQFVSKKALARKAAASGFRKCHDGRLPLDGFILSTRSSSSIAFNSYPPPQIPEGWKTAKALAGSAPSVAEWKSTSDVAKASVLDPKARAALLGETALPGKSVFDYLSPEQREKLAAASGRTNLPAALGEAPPDKYKTSEVDKQKYLWSIIPPLDKDLALAALNRGVNGWMPYAEDAGKRARYRGFLELRAGLRDVLPERASNVSVDDWKKELGEFAHAAFVFRPATGMMASRFTSSSRTFEGSFNPGSKDADEQPLLSTPAAKQLSPAEEAAKMGMYGPMTRSTLPFAPSRLVCKRFNVAPPVIVDPGEGVGSDAAVTAKSVPDVVSKEKIEQMMQDVAQRRFASGGVEGGLSEEQMPLMQQPVALQRNKESKVDAERNEALESERPGDAVFKAIFGSDDEDDD